MTGLPEPKKNPPERNSSCFSVILVVYVPWPSGIYIYIYIYFFSSPNQFLGEEGLKLPKLREEGPQERKKQRCTPMGSTRLTRITISLVENGYLDYTSIVQKASSRAFRG